MSKETTVTFKTNKQTKQEAKEFFASMGLNLSMAINLFLKDAVLNRKFSISLTEEPCGTLYPVDYDDLSETQKDAYSDSLDIDTHDFIVYSKKS